MIGPAITRPDRGATPAKSFVGNGSEHPFNGDPNVGGLRGALYATAPSPAALWFVTGMSSSASAAWAAARRAMGTRKGEHET